MNTYVISTRIRYALLILTLLISPVPATSALSPEAYDPVPLTMEAHKAYEGVSDYTAVFIKQERFGKKLGELETIEFKFRKPNDVYMKWIEKPNKGQEVIFRKGKNDNRLVAHKGGFLNLMSLNLKPESRLAMDGQHHRIVDAGIGPTGKLVKRGLFRGLERNEVTVTDLGIVKLNGRDALKREAVFPKVREGDIHTVEEGETLWDIAEKYDQDMYVILYSNDGVDSPTDIETGQKILVPYHYCYRTVSYVDAETRLLTKLEIYDWNNELYEYYEFRDVKLNVGLTDMDFDPDNPEYKF